MVPLSKYHLISMPSGLVRWFSSGDSTVHVRSIRFAVYTSHDIEVIGCCVKFMIQVLVSRCIGI